MRRWSSYPLAVTAVTMLTAAGPTASAAPAAPDHVTTHRFEWGEAWNRHRRGGADGLRRSSIVTLRLYKGGRLRAKDVGKLRESHLDRRWGYKEERTEWTAAWSGRWRRAGGKLQLRLRQGKHSCKRVEAWRGEKEKKLKCPVATRQPHLTCAEAEIAIEPSPGKVKKSESAAVPPGERQSGDGWNTDALDLRPRPVPQGHQQRAAALRPLRRVGGHVLIP